MKNEELILMYIRLFGNGFFGEENIRTRNFAEFLLMLMELLALISFSEYFSNRWGDLEQLDRTKRYDTLIEAISFPSTYIP